MQAFRIKGGKKLKGEVRPQGAKNEALQIICATLLTPYKVIINNIPYIIDINKLISLLISLGVKVKKWIAYHGYSINVDNDLEYYKKIKR